MEQYNLDTIAETTNTSGSGGGHYRGQRDATSVDWILTIYVNHQRRRRFYRVFVAGPLYYIYGSSNRPPINHFTPQSTAAAAAGTE